VNEAPAPVGPLPAKRDAAAVKLSWPLREGDVSYSVYRRLPPAAAWTLLANGVAEQVYTDPAAEPGTAYAYAVTALTSETEPYASALQPGEHLLLSAVESRIREEVVLAAGVAEATSVPPAPPADAPAVETLPPPADAEAPPDPAAAARAAITARFAQWESAVETGALDSVAALYDPGYADAQGWGAPYARRAWRAFFEGVRRPLMHYGIREWDTAAIESGVVRCKAFVHVSGIAISDPLGIVADVPIHLSRDPALEFWIAWTQRDGAWYITSTDPQLPNLRDLLSYTASPYADRAPGPDPR